MAAARAAAMMMCALLVGALVAGCTAQQPARPATEARPHLSAPAVPERIELPSASDGALEMLLGWTSQRESPQRVVARIRARQEAIRSCMTEQGLPYWVQVPDEAQVFVTAGDLPVPGTYAYAEQYGYGVWTQPEDEVYIELATPYRPGRDEVAYFDALSQSERAAYVLALYGTDPATGEHTQGCYQASAEGLRGSQESAVRNAAIFLNRLPGLPEFAPLDREWSECMAQGGFTESSPLGAAGAFASLKSAATDGGDVAVPWVETLTDAIALEERAVAVADHACRRRLGYASRFATISSRLQDDYLAEHRIELSGVRAALEANLTITAL